MANETKTDSPVSDTSEESVTEWIASNILKDIDFGDEKKSEDDSAKTTPEDEKKDGEEVLDPEVEKVDPEVEPEEEPKETEETEKAQADSVQKRIDKLTAQKKSAEEELAKLRLSLEEYEKSPKKEIVLTPTPKDPLSDILSLDDLKEREETIERMRAHCLRNPDGFSYTRDGKEIFVDSAEVREHLVETDKTLRKDIPARQKWLDTHSQVNAEAKKTFPELFDSRTADYQTAQSMLTQLPELKRIPSYNYIIGCAIEGERQVQARQKKKIVAAKPDTKKVPTPPTASAGAVANASKKTETKLTSRSSQGEIEQYIADKYLSGMKF